MAERLVRCRVRRSGYLIENGEVSAHVDLESGDRGTVLKSILENAIARDGNRSRAMYSMEVLDDYDRIITTYVLGK